MYSIYRINADELNSNFIESLKTLFKHRRIEIIVQEADDTAELEERRNLLVAETQAALTLFQQNALPAQTSSEVITQLRAGLAEN